MYMPNQAQADVRCGLGPLFLVFPEGLKNREAEDNKYLLVVLALRYQGPSLVSGSEREDAACG